MTSFDGVFVNLECLCVIYLLFLLWISCIFLFGGEALIFHFSRELAESSPYYEALKQQKVEVLFTYEENDEVVLAALKQFRKKNIVSAENYLVKAGDIKDESVEESKGQ